MKKLLLPKTVLSTSSTFTAVNINNSSATTVSRQTVGIMDGIIGVTGAELYVTKPLSQLFNLIVEHP